MTDVMVVMPTYNEAENLPLILDALLSMKEVALRVLVVDDGSPDGTGAIADTAAAEFPGRVNVLHRKEKSGLGPAYIAGFRRALELGADIVIQMDADFSHQPKYIPQLLAKIDEGYDVVIGSRWIKGGSVDESWGWFRKLLSGFANGVYVRTILRMPIADATGGFRAMRRDMMLGMDLSRIVANGYVFQAEIAYVAYKLGYRLVEIPIHFPDRVRGTSKMGPHIISEAAVRVWQILLRHHSLNPSQRKTITQG